VEIASNISPRALRGRNPEVRRSSVEDDGEFLWGSSNVDFSKVLGVSKVGDGDTDNGSLGGFLSGAVSSEIVKSLSFSFRNSESLLLGYFLHLNSGEFCGGSNGQKTEEGGDEQSLIHR